MSPAQLPRFDCFFNEHYPTILAEVAESDPSGAARRTRSGLASAYRFWSKVETDGDPVGWIHRVIADDRRNTRRRGGREPLDKSGDQASVDSNAEHRRLLSLARRQQVVAGAVVGTSALVALGAELFVVHR